MTQFQVELKELKEQAKEKGLKGYHRMGKRDLQLLLAGKHVPKKLKRNQKCVDTQTDFPVCNECGLKAYVTHLSFKADADERKRKLVYDGDLVFDGETGELVECEVDYNRY